jgi:hypothetical protein
MKILGLGKHQLICQMMVTNIFGMRTQELGNR